MLSAFLRKRMGAMALTGAILALNGIVLILIEGILTGYAQISAAGTIPAQGTIVACASGERSCQPVVTFQTRSGQAITFREAWSSSTFAPEDSVTVRYHPNNPYDAHIDFWTVNRFLLPGLGGIGFLLAIVGFLLFLFGKSHPAVAMLDRYYEALKEQDYAAAFSYLNPGIKNPQGEPATLDWFRQRAQAYDIERGRISKTALTGFAINRGRAQFTMKVTRSRMEPYKVKLSLIAIGDSWKINSFSIF